MQFDAISFLLGILIASFFICGLLMLQMFRQRGNFFYMWMCAFFWFLVAMDIIEATYGTLRLRSGENAFTAMLNLLSLPICANALLDMVTITRRSFRKAVIHFVPYLIAVFPPLFIADDTHYAFVVNIMAGVYSLVVGLLILYRANRFNQQLKEYYSSIEYRSLDWIYWVLGLLATMSMVWLFVSSNSSNSSLVLFFAVELILLLIVTYALYIQRPAEELRSMIDEPGKGSEMPEFFRLIEEKLPSLEADTEFFTNPSLTIQDMAMYVGTNRTYMSQYLNHIKKNTFYDYINNLRINYACKLLTETDIPVENLAIMAGFGSVSVFRRCMREKFDCTPSKYRQAMRTYK